MAALTAGTSSPDFKLQTMNGQQFSLRDALAKGPVVAAFFKISCPVCQYAFPFLSGFIKLMAEKGDDGWSLAERK